MKKQKNSKRIFLLAVFLIFVIESAFSEPISLRTEITSVYSGPHGIGFGLAPTGTNFMYYKYFPISKKLLHEADFRTRIEFENSNNGYFSGYNYKTGTPKWINKYHEIKDQDDYFLNGDYFAPQASVRTSLYQGFFINPIANAGPLISIGIEHKATYLLALESLDVHRGTQNPLFFNPSTGAYNEPFGPNSQIQAYPWLQDNRKTLTNSLKLAYILYLDNPRGFYVSDGLVVNGFFEFGPKWLFNDKSMAFTTSDYFQSYIAASEYLTLYSKRQPNGLNWLSIQLLHTNSFSYITGKVIPQHKLPSDRFDKAFTDTIAIEINGPQFIAWDCYSDITLSLNTACYFGNIVNEPSKATNASEWISYLHMRFHLRLFGFMHFSYSCGYDFMRGIHAYNPGLYQNAKVSFYISL